MLAGLLRLGIRKGFEVKFGLSFFATSRIEAPWYAPRRGTAVIASFAILFQAVLFGWHHHPLPFAWRSASTTLVLTPTGPEVPAAVDHDCDICFALGHNHGVIPAGLFAAMRPHRVPLSQPPLARVVGSPAPYLLFHPRAPPRV
jgi:hypothetical protein